MHSHPTRLDDRLNGLLIAAFVACLLATKVSTLEPTARGRAEPATAEFVLADAADFHAA